MTTTLEQLRERRNEARRAWLAECDRHRWPDGAIDAAICAAQQHHRSRRITFTQLANKICRAPYTIARYWEFCAATDDYNSARKAIGEGGGHV